MTKKILGRPRKKAATDRAHGEVPSRAPPEAAEQYIADQLKAIYDAVVAEPIPDRLLELLDRLESEAKK